MTNIETKILIEAPAVEVWRVLINFEEMPRWNPFITAISGSPVPGERLTVTIAPPGQRKMTFNPYVLAVTPKREFRWLSAFIGRWLFTGEHYFLLERPPGPNPAHAWRTLFRAVGADNHARRDAGRHAKGICRHERGAERKSE